MGTLTERKPYIPPKVTSREDRKKALQDSVNKYLEEIEEKVGDVKKIGKNTLAISGIVLGAYLLTRLLLSDSDEDESTTSNELVPVKKDNVGESILWSSLKGVATSVLLALAKDKLVDIIDHLTKQDVPENS